MPIAYTYRPHGVTERNSPPSTNIPMANQACTGRPSSSPEPIVRNVAPMLNTGVSRISSSTPRISSCVPSVTITGLNPSTATSRPLNEPIAAPRPMANRIAAHAGQPQSCTDRAISVPVAPTIEPIDRSTGPEIISRAMPTVATAITE